MSVITLILLLGGGLALLLLIIGIVITATSERSLVDDRLGPYVDQETVVSVSTGERASPVGDWLDTRIEKSGWGEGTARELARADLKLRVGEYIALMVILGIGLGFIGWFLFDQSVLFGIIGFVVGIFVPRLYVRYQQGQRLYRFDDQLADMLNLMVNGLRAGFSTMQALESVSKEMPPPLADEFRRVVQEMQLGIPMEDALSNLLRRIPSDDLELVITAINVQREVGGNLAEILDTISYTIRERVRIKGEIRVLVAQVMYSGRFLSLMPVFIFLALWFLNRPYMMLFFDPGTRLIGIPMLIVGALMVLAGYYVMNRIATIDV